MAYSVEIGNREKIFTRGISSDSGIFMRQDNFSRVPELGNREHFFVRGVSSNDIKIPNGASAKQFERGNSVDGGMAMNNAVKFIRKDSDLGNREKMFLSGVSNIPVVSNSTTLPDHGKPMKRVPSYKEFGILNYNKEIPNKTGAPSKIEPENSHEETTQHNVNITKTGQSDTIAYNVDIGNREKIFTRGISTDSGILMKTDNFSSNEIEVSYGTSPKTFEKTSVDGNMAVNNEVKFIRKDSNLGDREKMFLSGISNTKVVPNTNGLPAHGKPMKRVPSYKEFGILNYHKDIPNKTGSPSQIEPENSHEETTQHNGNITKTSQSDTIAYNVDIGNREKIFTRGISTDSGILMKTDNFSGNEMEVSYGTSPKTFERTSVDGSMTLNKDVKLIRKDSNLGDREKMFLSGISNTQVVPNTNGLPDHGKPMKRVPSYKEFGILNYHKEIPNKAVAPSETESQNGQEGNLQHNGDATEAGHSERREETPVNSRIIARVKKSRSFAMLSDAEDNAVNVAAAGGNERRVLVIYTGGTIGMVKNSDGVLEPRKGAFENLTKTFPQLHDQSYWSKRSIYDDSVQGNLVLPAVTGLDARIIYKIHERESLIDSANVTAEDWVATASQIKDNYEDYDGFVILHGTDTLAYTASALSFMLEDIGKPVVITGSQIPIFEPRSDGADNFVSALIVAGALNIPEVTVLFGSKLFRGNRTRKISSHNFNAFHSPNFVPLVEFGIDIEVNSRAIFRPTRIERCRLHVNMSKNVGIIRMFPSISAAVLRAFFQPPTEGVVLETYGSGNIPNNRHDIFEEIVTAVNRGVIVINITQCASGSVGAPVYETGRLIHACGVLSGYDMTPEAALAKLAYVLGKDEWDHAKKIEIMSTNIRGELTNLKSLTMEDNSLIDSLASSLKITSPKQLIEVTERVFSALLLYAIDKEEEVTIQRTQEMGADVNAQNPEGKTSLHEAIYKENVNIVKYLLLRGANVHVKTRSGESPLITAIQRDQHVIIRLLLDCGAHLASSDQQAVSELLSLAARRGSVRRLQSLKIAGADFNLPDEMKQTALHKAVLCNQPEVVKYLLDQNVKKDARDCLSLTALDYARQLRNSLISTMLED